VVKKIIQVPVDEQLLNSLDNLSKKQRRTRSEVIREACSHYLVQAKNEELDKLYEQGYMKIPEEPAAGKAQTAMIAEVASEESW
jgi:metal-responsive CopG/Arc/MetJ family transcriptional regulator